MTIQPQKNQLWESRVQDLVFRIVDTPVVNDQKWVYYVNEKNGKEYSCHEESFVSRFTPILNRG